MSSRVMVGLEDLTGQKIGTLRVLQMISRQPQPRYTYCCEECHAESTATHTRLRNGAVRCLNVECGRPKRAIRNYKDLESQAENARREAQRNASDLRMQAECEDYVLPSKVRQADNDYPTSARDQLALRERREAEWEERRPAREAAEREQEQREQQERKRVEAIHKAVTTGVDPWFHTNCLSESLYGYTLPDVKARDSWNGIATAQFLDRNPDYVEEWATPENAEHIVQYLHRNGANVFDADTLGKAVERLKEFRILKPKKIVVPYREPKLANLKIEKNTVTGRDPNTGLDREYSPRDIANMTADHYRRCFPVAQSVRDFLS